MGQSLHSHGREPRFELMVGEEEWIRVPVQQISLTLQSWILPSG
jgi:hypothetical protein